jgi:anaerobic selenocysteine-containing dehydrogenase
VGFEQVHDTLQRVPVEAWAEAADVAMADLERCADMIQSAKAMVVRVELGIQQGVNSTLNSYLEKLLILLTGSLGRPGTNQLHTWLAPLWGNSQSKVYAPTGDEIIGGLLPPNSFPRAVLSDHPERLRALFVDSSNPANTAADTREVERALGALELLVVVDVAMTETAQFAHYVLPASTQYEKTEYTLFNFEFPTNYFQVRPAVLPPLPGTLPEPEIYTQLGRALGLLPGDNALAPLRAAAERSLREFDKAFGAFMKDTPAAQPVGALVLYNTLGRTLPNGTAAAAALWPAAQACARRMPDAVRRALNTPADVPDAQLGERLFEALVTSRQGTAFTAHTYEEVWSLIDTPDHKVRLAIPELLDWLGRLDVAQIKPDPDFPFVLAAGQRRMFNANQIFRDPAWRRSDPDGALLVNPQDLRQLEASDGAWLAVQSPRARIVVRGQADASMRRGQLALPHGFGQAYPSADGTRLTNGPRVNLLTTGAHRDPIAGTPYHKNVAVRLEKATEEEAALAERTSRRIHGAVAAE